ncbi:TM2 domain-containing membrane protein YozV [Bacilli bacterium PM5-3]|nr:TM2 domain-containing membrane protein YozV [Bacilli bacterium PM5-3]MDH6603134.1 TM2 domain-containing membrane protein YozV [Bacilli bacterium PM5-9]
MFLMDLSEMIETNGSIYALTFLTIDFIIASIVAMIVMKLFILKSHKRVYNEKMPKKQFLLYTLLITIGIFVIIFIFKYLD